MLHEFDLIGDHELSADQNVPKALSLKLTFRCQRNLYSFTNYLYIFSKFKNTAMNVREKDILCIQTAKCKYKIIWRLKSPKSLNISYDVDII